MPRYFTLVSNDYTVSPNKLVDALRKVANDHNYRIIDNDGDLVDYLSSLRAGVDNAHAKNPRCKPITPFQGKPRYSKRKSIEYVFGCNPGFTMTIFKEKEVPNAK